MAATAIVSLAEWEWPDEVRYLACSPISHAAGFLVAPTLLKGGTVYLLPGFDPEKVLDHIERQCVNTLFLVPTMIYGLLDHPRTAEADLSNLEVLIYASAPMSPARLRDSLHQFGPVMMQCYGQTESIHVTFMRKDEHQLDRQERFLSCGRPPAGIRTTILDANNEPLLQGEIGEVCVRGPTVMHGYWKQPEATRETLRGGWLHTGDLGRMDEDGFIYLVDRAKDMIISGGFNVYSKEVEDALATHPAVAQCAVIGVPDEKWGEKVLAIVRLRDERVTEPELIEYVKEKKGSVQAPKEVIFVDQLPLTSLGKTDKNLLRSGYWSDQTRLVN
jgi:fatty-acyl-CoA synthase